MTLEKLFRPIPHLYVFVLRYNPYSDGHIMEHNTENGRSPRPNLFVLSVFGDNINEVAADMNCTILVPSTWQTALYVFDLILPL